MLWPALMGLWSPEGISSSGSSSGVKTGTDVVIKFSGVVGSTELPPETFLGVGPVEPVLADRLWLITLCPVSILALRAETILFADWPLPTC
jgi:hypothetical protein